MTKLIQCKPLLLALIVLWLSGKGIAQEEKILNFDVQLEVAKDRSLTVTEFIEVQVTGDIIKRGITRNLPRKRVLVDQEVTMRYDILEVEKNGSSEPFKKESSRDLILYLGDQNTFLDPGVYQYKIRYRVPDQIGFFEDYDEIYWNAIGQDVIFPIDHATCSVKLPAGAEVVQESAYVGSYGSRENATKINSESSRIFYEATRPLQPGEGLTVAVAIPKGVIQQAGILRRLGSFILLILGAIILLPYYFYTWWKYGQDPPTPAAYPQWDPPDNLSSASTAFIQKGIHQSKEFTASIVHLAIQGFLQILEHEKKGIFSRGKTYELVKLKDAEGHLPIEEQVLMNDLFRYDDRIEITGKYDKHIAANVDRHRSELDAQHKSFIWKGHNMQFMIAPILITAAVLGLSIWWLQSSAYADQLNKQTLIAFTPLAILGIVLYAYLIRKPTPEKLDLRSRIKGFKMYLELAEKERLRLLNPPEMTPAHFEAILPYAFALGVEHQWIGKFDKILQQAEYKPSWHNSPSPLYFSDHFGRSFTQSVSSAATKPSSGGSGSGGGGFSGGGGGGGGVGGW